MGAEDDVNQPEHYAQGQHPKFSGHCSAPVSRSTRRTMVSRARDANRSIELAEHVLRAQHRPRKTKAREAP